MPKRKSSSLAHEAPITTVPIPPPTFDDEPPPKRRASQRKPSAAKPKPSMSTNPNINANVLDAPGPLRASPDASESDEQMDLEQAGMDVGRQVETEDEDVPSLTNGADSDSSLSEMSDVESPVKPKPAAKGPKAPADKKANGVTAGKAAPKQADIAKAKKETSKEPQFLDPDNDALEEADEEEIQAALSRPPPACLCTYLRFSNPPVFTSRTCRIASILENRHPLRDPNEPPHATKNRPDKEQPASIERGQAFVESLGLANARDIPKMLRWNDRYGIKFMRLSSEMFPFASHPEYGYKLAPFAAEALGEAGKVAAELGHRLTTHPGQFTQLGSPRKQVIDNALRDLDYHAELLDLLKLPPQQDRDAVMILHLGGVFGDKPATLQRFRENYVKLPENVKKRLVLENDDVCYSVHDLLPICEELNIPFVLDFHHHNIIFDSDKIREGTKDIIDLFPRILATWKRKNITPKMHYSEPTPAAITGRQRRKHSARVATLPPCPPDMDLMIEAKDKEQAVFELLRTFKLPGFDTFNDIIPHVRKDDNKPWPIPKKKRTPKKKSKKVKDEDDELDAAEETIEIEEDPVQPVIPDDEVGMGGPEGRVYWPPGMEEWLRPVKRVVKPKAEKKDAESKATPAKKGEAAAEAAKAAEELEGELKQEEGVDATPAAKKAKAPTAKSGVSGNGKKKNTPAKKAAKSVPMPSMSDEEESDALPELSEEEGTPAPAPRKGKVAPKRQSGRAKKVDYAEEDGEI
ncbi:hypothetical protein G7Y79_00014g036670 [Physcia stellaris]|nr:hypothetical protein G7Y79_00014g036670 [Physcia stellaris]